LRQFASQADREQLRVELLEKLAAQAKLKLSSAAGEDGVILPETLILASIDESYSTLRRGRRRVCSA